MHRSRAKSWTRRRCATQFAHLADALWISVDDVLGKSPDKGPLFAYFCHARFPRPTIRVPRMTTRPSPILFGYNELIRTALHVYLLTFVWIQWKDHEFSRNERQEGFRLEDNSMIYQHDIVKSSMGRYPPLSVAISTAAMTTIDRD